MMKNQKKKNFGKRSPKKGQKWSNKRGPPAFLVYTPGPDRVPFPPNFVTEYWCEADYRIPTATTGSTQGSPKLNSLMLPFSPGGSSAFPSYTYLSSVSEATLNPTGWSTLCNGSLYQNYKVTWAEIKVKVTPTLTTDNVTVVVVPSDNPSFPINAYVARTQRYARVAAFNASKADQGVTPDGWLTISFNPYDLMGFTSLEGKADVSLGATDYADDPSRLLQWVVFVQTVDGDAFNAPALFQVKMHWRAQLWYDMVPNLKET